MSSTRQNILKKCGTAGVITLMLLSLLVPCVSAQVRGSEEKIDLPSDRISISTGNENYAYLIASFIESREHIGDASSEFSIYKSKTSDNFNKKLNEYQEKLKGYRKHAGEIATGQIVPDPKGIALDELTYGVAGGVSDIKTMADLSSILLSISQDTVDLCKEAREGGTAQTRVAEAKIDISEGYNSMIIQTASDAILFNEMMTHLSGNNSPSYVNTYEDIIKEVDNLPPNLFSASCEMWEEYMRMESDGDIGNFLKKHEYNVLDISDSYGYFRDSKVSEDTLITTKSGDRPCFREGRISCRNYHAKVFSIEGEKSPIIYFDLPYSVYTSINPTAVYCFRVPDAKSGSAVFYHYSADGDCVQSVEVYYPAGYRCFGEDCIKSYYLKHGFEVPEEYKVGEISATSQQLQSLQEIKSYALEIPNYSASDPYNYLDNLTDRWGIGAQILKEYPVSSNGKEAFEEYKSDVAYLSNLAFYSRLFVVKDGRLLTVKPNEPVIKSLINIGDFKDHVNYFEDRIKRNGQIAKEEYAKPFKTKATEWNTEIKELEDKSKLAESKLQEGKPGILGMIFGDESYDAATTKFNEAQRRIKETEKNIKKIAKSGEVQIEKVKSVEASLGTIEKDLNEIDIYFKKSGESSALYNIARAYSRYIENRCKR